MSAGFVARYVVWRAILAFGWHWLLAVPFTLAGVLTFVRDELASAEWQEQFRTQTLLALLPDWPWEWWVLAGLVVLFLATLEGAYREQKRLREQLDSSYKGRKIVHVHNSPSVCASPSFSRVFSVAYTPTRKSAEVTIELQISSGRLEIGYNLFTIFRDETNLAGTQDGHLFSVFVHDPKSLVPSIHKHTDRPGSRSAVKYHLAFASGESGIAACLNHAGRPYNVADYKSLLPKGQTTMIISETDDE
jgi:hypothetical protein